MLKRRSLSGIVENDLRATTDEGPAIEDIKLSPLIKSMKGAFKAPADFNYKEEMEKVLAEKYLEK